MLQNSKLPLDAIHNTKLACTLMTLGCELAKPFGIYVTYDSNHPKASGGVAHFLFGTNLDNVIREYVRIFEANTADKDLDDYIDALPVASRARLEQLINHALLVYGNKLLSNYQVICRELRDKVPKYVVTDGQPVYDQGKFIGLQEFSVKGVK